nr:MAG TPA: tail protein [Bacteriophage sp.]
MSIKKLTKRIWYGSDTTVDSEGKTVAAAPPIATNDGSEDWDLNGLVRGELYLNDNKDDPALFCLGSDNLPKRIGGGTASGGGGIVNVDVDVKEGRGIDVKKDLIGETVIFTVSHENTSSAVSTSNFDDLFVQNIGVDDFGHVTSVESARLATYLDERYLRKDIDDTAHGNILFDKKIGSSIFIDGWEGKGWEIQSTGAAILDSLRVRSDIYVGGNTGSPTFASGFTGWGWQIDTPTATGEMDNLFIRKTFTAYEIVYSQIYGLGGSQIVSDINKIARVEVMSDRYRCYMDDMDGLMLMNLRKGDGVRIQTRTGTTSIKYLFGRCIGVDSDYFDIAIPLIEGTGQPEAGDFALRWGNNEDTDRQGLIYLTTADSGAPFIDVYDGITDASTEGKLKARIGHLTGIRTQRGDQLSGYGAYLNGIYVENSTFILQNGDTIEQTFIAMNGKFESLIDSIRNDISAEGGNILVNSSFSQNTNYWTAANNVHFINVGGEYLWLDGSFYVEKDQVADIYNDNGQNVLRIRNTYILQQNAIMNIPDHTEEEEKTYSFSLFYKVLRPGSCGFGIPGTELYHEEQLSESDSYQKLSKVGKWNGKGDFELRFTGEILIYGVGLFSDEIADAIVHLQTQITQNEEEIKLRATKDYVDAETGKIYTKYDTSLSLKADKAELTSFKEEYDEFQQVVRRDYATQSWTSSKIQTEVGSYVDGALVGYATTSWTSSQISSSVKGLASESFVNQTAEGLNININNLGNRVDSVEGELDSVTDITGAFYSFGSNKMRLNRRIEMGSGSNSSFVCLAGMSPDITGPAFWAGSSWEDRANSAIRLGHDGAGWLAKKNIFWDINGNTQITGSLQTSSDGKRVTINPSNSDRLISFYNNTTLVGNLGVDTENNYAYLKLGPNSAYNIRLSTAGLFWNSPTNDLVFNLYQYGGVVHMNAAWPTDPNSLEIKFRRGEIYVDSNNYLRISPL